MIVGVSLGVREGCLWEGHHGCRHHHSLCRGLWDWGCVEIGCSLSLGMRPGIISEQGASGSQLFYA